MNTGSKTMYSVR